MTKVLAVYGIPDDNGVTIELNRGEVSSLSLFLEGTNVIMHLVDKELFEVQNIILGGIHESIDLQISKPDVIYNAICNADNQTKSLKSLEDKFSKFNIPIINSPQGILRSSRDLIYNNCKNENGYTIPKTKRITPRSVKEVFSLAQENGFDFPFIFRTVGDNNAINMELISSMDDSDKLEQFAYARNEFYIISFIDYISKDSIYRKYRILVIDGKPIVRHIQISDNWKVDFHNHTRVIEQNPHIIDEGKKFISTPITPNVQKMVDSLYDYLKLDFFGIDYHVDKEDNVIMFEANCCMKPFLILKNRAGYYDKGAEKIRKKLEDMVRNKL